MGVVVVSSLAVALEEVQRQVQGEERRGEVGEEERLRKVFVGVDGLDYGTGTHPQ